MIGADPLADTLGLQPGFTSGVTDFEQSLPERDLLYLDKSWRYMQELTAPVSAEVTPRPAYRMFEGDVTHCSDGWAPWVRAVPPDEVAIIAADLAGISLHVMATAQPARSEGSQTDYEIEYLKSAVEFVTRLAATNRGLVYLIG
ncbi:DUF1877 domain-containing protein [Arthrobacter castelli]|uniref:DUF1877 domain-containing protein n=1 Tax=Arthrobacter castelli TaxID=271431 RepID=UPI0012DEE45B|nr:DUF1877 domain-containing protein [Arthrobacter castelli]